jgi:hypothetical protein
MTAADLFGTRNELDQEDGRFEMRTSTARRMRGMRATCKLNKSGDVSFLCRKRRSSSPRVAKWLGEIREFFPASVVQIVSFLEHARDGGEELLSEAIAKH